jgi:hypothetical protein
MSTPVYDTKYVLVSTVKPGDVINYRSRDERIPMLMVTDTVKRVESTNDGRTFLHWEGGGKAWWSNLDIVRVELPFTEEAR